MYHHQQYESRMWQCQEDAPFFREAVSLIDQCTKLPKDDRISLRNQIKEYLRSLRDNRSPHNEEDLDHLQQLVQIFVEANRKKSLGKIHKGDRLMDWIQIKLRKLIDQSKKQKHRKELQNFRNHRFIDVKKKPERNILQRPADRDPFQILGISRNVNQHSRVTNQHNEQSRKTNDQKYLIPSSLSRSREKSPVETSRKSSQSYAQYSYHKNFPFLRKTKEEGQPQRNHPSEEQSQNRQLRLEKRIAGLNRSVDQLSKYNASTKVSTSRSKYQLNKKNTQNRSTAIGNKTARGNESKREKQTKKTVQPWKKEVAKPVKETSKQEISKLTKLFTEQLNSAPQAPSFFQPEQTFMSPTFNFTPLPQPPITSYNSYEQSSKKLQEMLQGSKTILEQLNSNSQPSITNNYFPQKIYFQQKQTKKEEWTDRREEVKEQFQRGSSEKNVFDDIFTPPDFLAQCRKLISSSHKKPLEDWKEFSGTKEDSGTKLAFNNILSDSREQKQFTHEIIPSKLGQMTFNEVISQNPSANISSKKPESEVQFQLKNTSIFTTSQLLFSIFKESHSVALDRYQLGHLMSQCDLATETLLQEYCSVLDKDHRNVVLEFRFVAMVKFCFSCGKTLDDSKFATFLCSILDMKKNGYVSGEDIDDFLESMEGSGVEQDVLDEITSLLHSVFSRCCVIEGAGSIMTRWSLYYLELTRDEQASILNDLLSRFEFQIDVQE